jgi:outer membrane protein OmpA-like peptidoglycan-associated protein
MRTLKLSNQFFFLTLLSLLNSYHVYAKGGVQKQAASNRRDLEMGFYVVIGSFNVYENVQRYTKELIKTGQPCEFAFSDTHHHYYAFTYHSDSLALVKNELLKLREKINFKDAWILKINSQLKEKRLDENADLEKEKLIVKDPSTSNTMDSSSAKDISTGHHEHSFKTHNANFNIYKLKVNTCDSSLNPIKAHIKVANGEKSVLLKTIESQKSETISCPVLYSQIVELICEDVLGYKKRVFFLDLSSPVNDSTNSFVKIESDQIIVNLSLTPLEVGDVMTLYNVFFYPNTNILRSKSNYELQKLVEVLKNNPKWEVMINGHVNGNSSGPITRLKEDCKDLFNPTDTELIKGSALKLSELRAETIKYYLIQNSIDENRLQTKGWGGKKMLFKEDSPQHPYNIRAEIEILKE